MVNLLCSVAGYVVKVLGPRAHLTVNSVSSVMMATNAAFHLVGTVVFRGLLVMLNFQEET